MVSRRQLCLVVQRNFLIRRRQPVLLALELLWPVGIFLVIVAIRLSTLPSEPKGCHYPQRALPSAGALPFLRSFVCNLNNECRNESSTIRYTNDELDILTKNESVRRVLRDLPSSVSLLEFCQKSLKSDEARDFLQEDLTFGSFFNRVDHLRRILIDKLGIDPEVASVLLDSTLNFSQIFGVSGLSPSFEQLNELVCNANKLRQYVILPETSSLTVQNVSASLCQLDAADWTILVQTLQKSVNATKIVSITSKLTTLIGDQNSSIALNDVANMIETIGGLNSVDNLTSFLSHLPTVSSLVPDLLRLTTAMKNSDTDLQFAVTMMDDVESLAPHLQYRQDWQKLRTTMTAANNLMNWFKFTFAKYERQLTVGDAFGSSRESVRKALTTIAAPETVDSFLNERIPIETISTILSVRNIDDLKTVMCTMTQSEILTQICDNNRNQAELWKVLFTKLDLSNFISMADEQTRQRRYRDLSLREMNDNVQQITSTMGNRTANNTNNDAFDTILSVINNLRFQPMLDELQNAHGNAENASLAIMKLLWKSMDSILGNSQMWLRVKQQLYSETVVYNWMSKSLKASAEKRMTFGKIYETPTTMDHFAVYILENLPTIMVVQMLFLPKPEFTQILEDSQTKSPEEYRKMLCESPGLVNLIDIPSAVDSNRVLDLQKTLCRFDMNVFTDEMKTAFEFERLLNDYSSPNYQNTTIVDFYNATRTFQETAKDSIQFWKENVIMRAKVDWSPLTKAMRERSEMQIPNNTENTAMWFARMITQQLQEKADNRTAMVYLELSRALDFDLQNIQGKLTGTTAVSALVNSWAAFVSSIFETTADNTRLDKLVRASDWKKAFCSDFSTYFVDPSPNRLMQENYSRDRSTICSTTVDQLSSEASSMVPSKIYGLIHDIATNTYQYNKTINATSIEAVWKEFTDHVVNIQERATDIVNMPFDREANLSTIHESMQKLSQSLRSGTTSYYANLAATSVRAMDAIPEFQNSLPGIVSAALTTMDEILIQVHRQLLTPTNISFDKLTAQSPYLQEVLIKSFALTDDMMDTLRVAILHPEQIINAGVNNHQLNRTNGNFTGMHCEDVHINDYVEFTSNATRQQIEELKEFICSNLPTIRDELTKYTQPETDALHYQHVVNWTACAIRISEIGHSLEQREVNRQPFQFANNDRIYASLNMSGLRNAVDRFLQLPRDMDMNKPGSTVADAYHKAIETLLKTNSTANGFLNHMQTSAMWTAGMLDLTKSTLNTAINVHQSQKATISLEDFVPNELSAMRDAVRMLERLPDYAEYFVQVFSNNYNKLMELNDKHIDTSKLCDDRKMFLQFFPNYFANGSAGWQVDQTSNKSTGGNSTRFSGDELYKMICQGGGVDAHAIVDQVHQQFPELYAAYQMSDDMMHGRPADNFYLNISKIYADAGDVYRKFQQLSTMKKNFRFADERFYNASYWTSLMKHFQENTMLNTNNLSAVVGTRFDSALTAAGVGPTFAGVRWVSEHLTWRLMDLHNRHMTLDDMLKNEPELQKLVSWADANLVNATEILAATAMQMPSKLQEMLTSSDIRATLCKRWSDYLVVPSNLRTADVINIVNQFCSIDLSLATFQALNVLDPNNTKPAQQKLSDLQHTFAVTQNVTLQPTLDAVMKPQDTLVNIQKSDPKIFGSFRFDWLHANVWHDMVQHLIEDFTNPSRVSNITNILATMLDDPISKSSACVQNIKSMLIASKFLNWQTSFLSGELVNDAIFGPNSEPAKLTPHLKRLRQLVDDAAGSFGNLPALFTRLAQSPDRYAAFCQSNSSNSSLPASMHINLPEYLISNMSSSLQRTLCTIDGSKFLSDLSNSVRVPDNRLASELAASVQLTQNQLNTFERQMHDPNFSFYGGTRQEWSQTLTKLFGALKTDRSAATDALMYVFGGPMTSAVARLPPNVIREADSMIVTISSRLKILRTRAQISLNELFPDSPYFRQSLERTLPMLPQMFDVLLWSSTNSTVFASPEKFQTLCDQNTSWSKVFVHPTMTSDQWRNLQYAVCWSVTNWPQIRNELQQELHLSNSTSYPSSTAGELVTHFRELISYFQSMNSVQLTGINTDWMNPAVYQSLIDQWMNKRPSLDMVFDQITSLSSTRLKDVPKFKELVSLSAKAIRILGDELSKPSPNTNRMKSQLRQYSRDVQRAMGNEETTWEQAVMDLVENSTWDELKHLPTLVDKLFVLADRLPVSDYLVTDRQKVQPYLNALKSTVNFINTYDRRKPDLSNSGVSYDAIGDNSNLEAELSNFGLSDKAIAILLDYGQLPLSIINLMTIPDEHLNWTFCDANRTARVFSLSSASESELLASELCGKDLRKLRVTLIRPDAIKSFTDQLEVAFKSASGYDYQPKGQSSSEELKESMKEFLQHAAKFASTNGDWNRDSWTASLKQQSFSDPSPMSERLIQLAGRARSVEFSRLVRALEEVDQLLNTTQVWTRIRPMVLHFRSQIWVDRLKNFGPVFVTLKDVLRSNETIELMLQTALLNDPIVVDMFNKAELDTERYLTTGFDMSSQNVCQNRTIGGVLRFPSEYQKAIDQMLCHLDLRRLESAVDNAIDTERLLNECRKALQNATGSMSINSSVFLIPKCEHCSIDGSELLEDFAELASSDDWPTIRQLLAEALRSAEIATAGTPMEADLENFRGNANAFASAIRLKNGEFSDVKESAVLTVRELLPDPDSFTDFLEEQLLIPPKFGQILLSTHISLSQLNSPHSWCDNGQLSPTVFVAVDITTFQELEKNLCMLYYPAIVDELDRRLSSSRQIRRLPTNHSSTFQSIDWATVLDQMAFVALNMRRSSMDAAAFDANASDLEAMLSAIKSAIQNPTVDSATFVLGHMARQLFPDGNESLAAPTFYTNVVRMLSDKITTDDDGLTLLSLLGNNSERVKQILYNTTGIGSSDFDLLVTTQLKPFRIHDLTRGSSDELCTRPITDYVDVADEQIEYRLKNLFSAACAQSPKVFFNSLSENIDIDNLLKQMRVQFGATDVKWSAMLTGLEDAAKLLVDGRTNGDNADFEDFLKLAGITQQTLSSSISSEYPQPLAVRRALRAATESMDALNNALKPFTDVSIDLPTIFTREKLLNELIDRLESSLEASANRVGVSRLQYLATKTGSGDQGLRNFVCSQQFISSNVAFGEYDSGAVSRALCYANLTDWPTVLRNRSHDSINATVLLSQLLTGLDLKFGINSANFEDQIPLTEKNLSSSWNRLSDTIMKLKGDRGDWPTVFLESIRALRSLPSTSQENILNKATELSAMYEATYGGDLPMVDAWVKKTIGDRSQRLFGSSLDWTSMTLALADYADRIFFGDELPNGDYESTVRSMLEPLSSHMLTACSLMRERLSTPNSAEVTKYISTMNDQLKALPGYKEVICSMTKNADVRQLYDNVMYQLKRTGITGKQYDSTPCSSYVDQTIKFLTTAASSVDWIYSDGHTVVNCIQSSALADFFHSTDKYLDMASTASRLVTEPRLMDSVGDMKNFLSQLDKMKGQFPSIGGPVVPLSFYLYQTNSTEFDDNFEMSDFDDVIIDVRALSSVTDKLQLRDVICPSLEKLVVLQSHQVNCTMTMTDRLYQLIDWGRLRNDTLALKQPNKFLDEMVDAMSTVGPEFFKDFSSSVVQMIKLSELGADGNQVDGTNRLQLRQVLTAMRQLNYDVGGLSSLSTLARRMLSNTGLAPDIQTLLKGVIGLNDIKENVKYILEQNYTVAELINYQDEFRAFLIKELNLPENVVENFLDSEANLDMILLTAANDSVEICKNVPFESLFAANSKAETAQMSDVFCSMGAYSIDTFWQKFLDSINMKPFIKRYVADEMRPKLEEAGLTMDDAKRALDTISRIPEMTSALDSVSRLKKRSVPDSMDESQHVFYEQNDAISSSSSSVFDQSKPFDIGNLLCGFNFQAPSINIPLIRSLRHDGLTREDEWEMSRLPTDYCRDIYKNAIASDYGPLIWRFLKPLVRGKILVTPNTPSIRRVIEKANVTFSELGDWLRSSKAAADLARVLTDWSSEQGQHFLMELTKHPLLRALLSEWAGVEPWELEHSIESLQRFSNNTLLDLREMARTVHNISECVLLDRFVFFDDEKSLQNEAQTMLDRGDLLAAVIFDINKTLHDQQLPKHMKYKVRMDTDRLPRGDQLFPQFINSGSRDNFFQDLLYLHGFVLVQDIIDSAIIDVQGQVAVSRVGLYTQQMPIPCYKKDDLVMYLSYFLSFIAYISWLPCVAIKFIDITSINKCGIAEVMKSIGVSRKIGFIAWLITSSIPGLITGVIVTIVLKYGQMLPLVDPSVLLVLTFLFDISLSMFSFLVSTFFTKTKLATITGVIIYLISYLPFIIVGSVTQTISIPYWSKIIACFSSTTAFSCAISQLAGFDARGIGGKWGNIVQSSMEEDDVTISVAMIMIVVDAVLYFGLATVVTVVYSKTGEKGGLRQLIRSFNSSSNNGNKSKSYLTAVAGELRNSSGKSRTSIDSASINPKAVVGLSLRGLSKEHLSSGNLAVSNLTFDLYEGEVTTLLGRNGAGKTTTIHMLTGLSRPTAGTATVYGADLETNSVKASKYIGFCPQYNILYDELTVREHLKFYGSIKGLLSPSELEADIERLLRETNLIGVAGTLASRLSGGTRRRLCVAIAFCGGSKCVILDEPTAGVDPVARRELWEIIESQKKHRTVLLCTHYMDEAELLSDRIAVLHKGQLLRWSTVRSLQRDYGEGCLLKFIKAAKATNGKSIGCKTPELLALVRETFPDAKLIGDYGQVVDISIPRCLRPESEQCLNWETLFQRLENAKQQLGIEHYAFRNSNLEEAFLNISKLADKTSSSTWLDVGSTSPSLDADKVSIGSSMKDHDSASLKSSVIEKAQGLALKLRQLKALLIKRALRTKRDWRLLMNGLLLPCLFVAMAMGFNMLKPIRVMNNDLSLMPELYGPDSIMFINSDPTTDPTLNRLHQQFIHSSSIGSSCLSDADVELRKYCSSPRESWNRNSTPIFSGSVLSCNCDTQNERCETASDNPEPAIQRLDSGDYLFDLSEATNKIGLDKYLAATENSLGAKRFGGWSIPNDNAETLLNVWFSTAGLHTLPAFINGANNIRLRATISSEPAGANREYGITTYSQPITSTERFLEPDMLVNKIADVGVALVLVAAFSFIPAALTSVAVEERTSKQRHMQRLNGVGDRLYWVSCFIWDMFFYTLAVLLACVIISIFGQSAYMARLNMLATFVLLLLYGMASLALMYNLQRFFTDSSLAFVGLFGLSLFTAVNSILCLMLLMLITQDGENGFVYKVVKSASFILSPYVLGSGLAELSVNQFRTELNEKLLSPDPYRNPFSLDVIGYHIITLLAQFAVYLLLGLLTRIDCSCLRKLKSSWRMSSVIQPSQSTDSDVVAERDRVISGKNAEKSIVRLINLTKRYRKRNAMRPLAVNSVTLGIERGECFGLLGLNGAGKTTTFEMLAGGHLPSRGILQVLNKELRSKNDWSRLNQMLSNCRAIGYCPQENTLDGYLTVSETLEHHLATLGYHGQCLKEMVDSSMEGLQLKPFGNRFVRELSGGYKRLLCVALALLDSPPLLLLDEPTAGMDPRIRRVVWARLLNELDAGRAIVLSTHSMEDSEALCSRLAIMGNGEFMCLGTLNSLQSKLGYGYNISIWMADSIGTSEVKRLITSAFPLAVVQDRTDNCVRVFIPTENNKLLPSVFSWLRSAIRSGMTIADFSVTEMSLDDMFVNFARHQISR